MKKKAVTKKLQLNKLTVANLNELQSIKGGITRWKCDTEGLTCISMCDDSCYVGTCQG